MNDQYQERGNITTDYVDIKRIIREYYIQLITTKLNNFLSMDKFPEKHKLPEPPQEITDKMNNTISIKEIELTVLSNFPIKQILGPDSSTGEFYQILKKKESTNSTKLS